MNKAELILAMSDKTGTAKKDCETLLNAFIEVVTEELEKDGKVQLIGFGTFEVAKRSERKCRNPKTGEELITSASKAPKFKAGKLLKQRVNK